MGDGSKQQEVTVTASGPLSPASSLDATSNGTVASSGLGPILDALPWPVLLTRADRIVTANEACAEFLQMGAAKELSGRSLSGLFDARAADDHAKQTLFLWLLEGKKVRESTSEVLSLLGPSGERVLVRLTRKFTTSAADGTAVVTVSSLVPERPSGNRLNDRSELSRLAALGQRASGAAQAVNNPLAYIASNVTYSSERLKYISALLDDSSPLQVSDPRTLRGLLLPVLEALAEAGVGAARASQLIKDLRSLIEQDTVLAPIDVRLALEAALNMAEGEVSLWAHLRLDLGAQGYVLANSTRLTQLLLSLIVSRAQALTRGSPQLYRIDVRSRTEEDWVVVSVSDNGRSVDASLVGAALTATGLTGSPLAPASSRANPAQPAHGPPESRHDLTMCEQLAASLGGTLELGSAENGTAVILRLPMTDASRKQPLMTPVPPRPGRRTRVLIVDNEPLIVRALSRLLRADYDVETAGGGYEALDLIRHVKPFDLVLCDLAMPEMSGIELFQEAVRLDPEIGPRFVFVTGGAVPELTQTVLQNLPNRVLEKPIQPAILRQVVEQLLGTGAAARAGR